MQKGYARGVCRGGMQGGYAEGVCKGVCRGVCRGGVQRGVCRGYVRRGMQGGYAEGVFRRGMVCLLPLLCTDLHLHETTSAGPEQALPWLYYHRTIGVEVFIMFVEGKAALPGERSSTRIHSGMHSLAPCCGCRSVPPLLL